LQLLQGLSRRIRDDVDRDARIVATGGMLNVFRTDLDWLDATDPDLTLIGIYYAFRDAHGGT